MAVQLHEGGPDAADFVVVSDLCAAVTEAEMAAAAPLSQTSFSGTLAPPDLAAREQAAGLQALLALAHPEDPQPEVQPPGPAPEKPTRRLPVSPALVVILAVQADFSARLFRVNTAFGDEALYLHGGHLQWAHWLTGAAAPAFPTYFSGAPVIYPPIAALADSIGGLTGARALSLAFTLIATCLLWAVTARLYSRRAALFACGLWGVMGPTLHVGAFATFDAMSMCLLALATWLAVRAGKGRDGAGWIFAAASAMALANATAYSSAIFDPVVIAVAVLVAYPEPGGKAAVMRGLSLLGTTITALILLVTAGGGLYSAGIGETIFNRERGYNTGLSLLSDSWRWTGSVAALAVAGLILGLVSVRTVPGRLLLGVLVAAGLLVPLEQIRIHTLTSLDKHADVGAWFAAIAAGYAADRILSLVRHRGLRTAAWTAGIAGLALAAQLGLHQGQFFFGYPNSAQFIRFFRHVAASTKGPILDENPSIAEYYLNIPWQRVSSTRSILQPDGADVLRTVVGAAGNPAVYARYIHRDYFAVVAINFQATPGLDREIAKDLYINSRYQPLHSVPYGNTNYVIWVRLAPGARR